MRAIPLSTKQASSLLHTWYHDDLGRRVWQAECSMLNHMFSRLSARLVLQIGGLQRTDWLHTYPSGFQKLIYLGPTIETSLVPSIQTDFETLPVQPNQIDAILVWHVLELVSDPASVLREAIQALRPEVGYMVLFLCNTRSFWPVCQRVSRQSLLPWCRQFYALRQLKAELAAQHAIIEYHHTFFFDLPCKVPTSLRKLHTACVESLHPLGWGGAISCVVARKRLSTLTPLRHKNRWVVDLLPAKQTIGSAVKQEWEKDPIV